jgi:tRNA(Ile)-lysidine synthase
VAVSGGGDSLALLHLISAWARTRRLAPPVALIVDHGLQEDSRARARKARAWAKALGAAAHVLTVSDKLPAGDLEATARQARYRLMGSWLARARLGALYVGHTRDDQAETFLLRMARGSGLDGLAAMRMISQFPVPEFRELVLVRPMLALRRDEVRAHLTGLGQEWLEDPMNRDPRFSRVRIRESWPMLESLGLTRERLAGTADHLFRAREALDSVTLAILARSSRVANGTALVERQALSQAPRELGLRALAALLMAVSGQTYRPRFSSLEQVFDRIRDGTLQGGCTLHGCRVAPAPRKRAVFGPGTVLIEAESRRRAGRPEADTQNT